LDALTQLAAYICGTPISLVSLVDGQRQWFKSNYGLDGVTQTPREYSFCQHAMVGEGVYEVEDATSNPLFCHNPLVTGEPRIRFYAGAPLVTPDGHPLGAICTIDTKPRTLTATQRESLLVLAQEVMSHLELRRARVLIAQERQDLENLLRLINDQNDSGVSAGRQELFVKHDHKLRRIKVADITYVEALGDYVNIHAGADRYTVYTTMKDILLRLPMQDFVRVHRKYIVNLNSVVAIDGDVLVVDGGRSSTVPIGNSYKADLLGRLNLI
jgi:GAF domain-containing protein